MMVLRRFAVQHVWRWVDVFAATVYGGEPGPLGTVRCQLTDHPVAQDEFLELELKQTLSGRQVLTGFATGGGRRWRLSPGRYSTRIVSDYYQDATPTIQIEAQPQPDQDPDKTKIEIPALRLQPDPARYPFRNTILASSSAVAFGGIVRRDGTPLAKVTVEMLAPSAEPGSPLRRSCSSENGEWYLSVHPKENGPWPVKFTFNTESRSIDLDGVPGQLTLHDIEI